MTRGEANSILGIYLSGHPQLFIFIRVMLCATRIYQYFVLWGTASVTNASSTVSAVPLSFGLLWIFSLIISSYFGIASVPFQMTLRRFRAAVEKARDDMILTMDFEKGIVVV